MTERQFDTGDEEQPSADLAGGHKGGGPNGGGPTRPGRRQWAAEPTGDPDAIVTELTAAARVRAAAVTAETAALVDAVAALRPYEGRSGHDRCGAGSSGASASPQARPAGSVPSPRSSRPSPPSMRRSDPVSSPRASPRCWPASPPPPTKPRSWRSPPRSRTGAQLQQIAHDYRQVRDAAAKGAARPDPASKPSEASWGWDDKGRFRGSWNLRPDDGATIEAALEAALAHLRPTEGDIDNGRGQPGPRGGPRRRRHVATR